MQAESTPMDAGQRAVEAFRARYRADPDFLASAPGRVNLIGDHTDYQDGFVMPVALEQRAVIAFRLRSDHIVEVEASDLDSHRRLDLENLGHFHGDWSEYVTGVAFALGESGRRLSGWEGALASDVPRGSGLSSSAALEVATTRAFAAAGDFDWIPTEMALVSQRAENEWVGMQCGIMDQLISAAAVEKSALLIDCRSLETTAVALPASTSIIVMDTSTRRGLVDSEYNTRRADCEAAASALGVSALRDASLDDLDTASDQLTERVVRRARHVISENARVVEAVAAGADPSQLGSLMTASHRSLRDDFEVSSPVLDSMVEAALDFDACHGARLTGAGFAGAAVALVDEPAAVPFMRHTAERFRSLTGLDPTLFAVEPRGGATLETYREVQP